MLGEQPAARAADPGRGAGKRVAGSTARLLAPGVRREGAADVRDRGRC